MLHKLCCWQAEHNGVVNSSSSKFAPGIKTYQLSSIKHAASKTHPVEKTAKEDFDVRKAGLSVTLRKVVQEIPPGSAIAKSMQEMNHKDQATVTELPDRLYYIALNGLPFTQFNIYILKNYTMSLILAHVKIKQPVKVSSRIFQTTFVLCNGSTNNNITEQKVIFVIYVNPKINLPVMKFFEIAAPVDPKMYSA